MSPVFFSDFVRELTLGRPRVLRMGYNVSTFLEQIVENHLLADSPLTSNTLLAVSSNLLLCLNGSFIVLILHSNLLKSLLLVSYNVYKFGENKVIRFLLLSLNIS